MSDEASNERGTRASAFLKIATALMLLVVVVLILPWLKTLIEGKDEKRIRIAVEAASKVCLLDPSEKESNDFLAGVIAKIGNLSAEGKLERETARKSVDLAINEHLLVEERERVRSCMKDYVPKLLEQQGLVKNGADGPAITPAPSATPPAKPDAVAWNAVPFGEALPEPVDCPCLARSLLPPPYPTPYPKGSIAQVLNQCGGEVRLSFYKAVPRQSAETIVDNFRAVAVLQSKDVRTFDVGGAVAFQHRVELCAK